MEDLDQLLDEADRYCGNTEDNKHNQHNQHRHSSNTEGNADTNNKDRHCSKVNNNKVMLDQQVAR